MALVATNGAGGRCMYWVMYIISVLVLLGIGALIGALCVWYLAPRPSDVGLEYKGVQDIRYAACVFNAGAIYGTVSLMQEGPNPGNELTLQTNITGIPYGYHGFHIHTWGAPADGDCTKCGGHFNPGGYKHGGPEDVERHVGDLGNIYVSSTVYAEKILDSVASLWGTDSIIGRSLVIHEGKDDLGTKSDKGSQTSGNAGKRLACCTIYLVEA